MIYKKNLKCDIHIRVSSSLLSKLLTLSVVRRQSVPELCRYILDEYCRNLEKEFDHDTETY